MEITSFILGVCAVIVIMMIVGTSVNLMSFRTLKKDFDNFKISSDHEFENIYRRLEITDQEVYSRIAEVEQAVVRHTDSRVDKLETKVYKDFDLYRKQGKNY